MRPAIYSLLCVAATLGCAKQSPPIDPDLFPRSVASLESKTEEILAAFEDGSPQDADRPLHMLGKTFSTVKRLAGQVGLEASQTAGVNAALEELDSAFKTLHEPLHEEEFPEDFDFEPIRAKLETGLESLRAALPADVLKVVQARAELRASRRAKAAAAAGTTEDDPGAEAEFQQAPAGESGDVATESPDGSDEETADAPDEGDQSDASRGAATAAVAAAPPPPLCPTVMMFDEAGWRIAPERVNRAAAVLGDTPTSSRWVQFVPTLSARLRTDLTVEAYGVIGDRSGSWASADNFTEATGGLADRFRDQFAAAFGQAVRRGLHVAILPHLDPAGGEVQEWRNYFDFAPAEVVGAGSYESLLIDPIADAIAAEATADTRVDFCLSGEMGQSLFERPADYLRLLERLRARFADQPNTTRVRLGVALNWNGLAGQADTDRLDRERIRAFFAACDFVGISCYAPVSVPPKAEDFATALDDFLVELRGLGGVLRPGGVVVMSEAGIGGGYPNRAGNRPTPAEVAAKPYEGRGSSRFDPWASEDMKRLRTLYHVALCDFLSSATEHPVEKAFLWSEGPWDPQGIADARFRDEEIARQISAHNDAS